VLGITGDEIRLATDRDGQAVAELVTLHPTVRGLVPERLARAGTPVLAVVCPGFWSGVTKRIVAGARRPTRPFVRVVLHRFLRFPVPRRTETVLRGTG